MAKKYSHLAKISRPFLSDILPRKRLFDLLSGREKRPVTWVFGPGGSGKTSLVASYLDACGLGGIWYQLDTGDADAASFFYYMRLAAQKAAPHYRTPLPLLTPEYRQGLPVFTRRYFEALFRRLKPPCAIVLDNYQSVTPESALHMVISQGLATLPDGIRAIIISRHQPPPAWIGLRAGDQVALLGWNDIRLTSEEATRLVRHKTQSSMPDDILAQLHAKTDGWVAGLILLIEHLKAEGMNCQQLDSLAHEEIFDYFVEQVLAALDSGTRDFLLKTALLPKMTARLAESLTGRLDAGRILSDLHLNNFFTVRHAGAEPVFQYHPLFRQFLVARAKEALPAAQITDIQKQAANLLQESGDVEEAARLLIAARQWPELIGLILDQAQTCVEQGREMTLNDWIAGIPAEIRAGSPWILYWTGICRIATDPAAGLAHFEKALRLFEAQKNAAGALMAWSGVVQTYIFMCDDFKPLDRWIAWLDDYTRDGAPFPSPVIHAIVAAGMIGALEWRMPAHPDVRKWLSAALSTSRQCPQTDIYLRAFTNCALFYGWMGEFTEGAFLIDEINKISKTRPASPYRLILCKVLEAILYNSSADWTDRAAQSVSEGLEIASSTGVHVIDQHLYAQALSNSLQNRDLDKCKDLLVKMESSLVAGGRTHAGHYYYFAAWHQWLRGNPQVALAYTQHSLELLQEAGVPFSETVVRVLLTHMLYATGRLDEALEQLDGLKNALLRTNSAYFEYLYHLTAAYFAFQQNDPDKGRSHLQTALREGQRKGFFTNIYFWLPEVMSTLCAEAFEAGIETDHVRALACKLDLVPCESDVRMGNWPWRFEMVTLGEFAIMRDGKAVQASGKVQKKPLQMLKTLIILGPGEIRKERLIDLLWPDSDGDAGNTAFHTTLHRLRRWIGDDRVIQFNDGALLLDRRYCRVDAWTFEQLWARALQAPPMRETLDQAMALYKGVFLPADEDLLPAISVRERLRSKFLKLVAKAGHYLEQCGDFNAALNTYYRGLEFDSLAEELHQGLMACYLQLGRKAEALATYQRCRTILQSELGVAPAPQTERLKNRILQH